MSTTDPTTTTVTSPAGPPALAIDADAVVAALGAQWFCTLATSSAANRPHAAGVLYALVDRELWINTDLASRKARNVAEQPRVAVCVAVPAGPDEPPATISLQGTATLVAVDDPLAAELIAAGRLAAITSHGELERPDTVFVRITPAARLATYGVGVSPEAMAADPLSAFGSVTW